MAAPRPRAAIKEHFPDFTGLLAGAAALARLRAVESIGRPLGDARYLARVERLTARQLRPRKRDQNQCSWINKCTVTVMAATYHVGANG
jgi:hypothetical protein